ncbi:hypothetical protein Tco_1103811 [Tanacetum coccineum]
MSSPHLREEEPFSGKIPKQKQRKPLMLKFKILQSPRLIRINLNFHTPRGKNEMVNFEPDPRVPIILGRPFLRTTKALIDLYEETLTLRVGKEELVYYAYLLSDDVSHNLASEVISDHEPEQNESSITFSPRSDPLHHEFAGEVITLPSRNDREFGEYLSLMTVLCEISTSQSQENVHAQQSSVIESLPISPIPVEDSEPVQEDIDIFLVPDDLIPPGVENDISKIGR